jgi:hypothetical protein
MNIHMKKNNLIIRGVLLLMLSPLAGVAQQETAVEKPALPPQQETTTPPPAPAQPRSNEPFVPTETISEDLSVPFPVDI